MAKSTGMGMDMGMKNKIMLNYYNPIYRTRINRYQHMIQSYYPKTKYYMLILFKSVYKYVIND